MSALSGLWRFDRRPDAAEACRRMLAAQSLYGPDAIGDWSDGGIAVGRQLMRLLPEDTFDRQPLASACGHLILVADIRLDNRDELGALLEISPMRARNLCDAAILLAAFERWGEACFHHLIGDYAFAVWDNAHRRLILARDPTGQRPLHYHRGSDFFAFASMPKGLHALSEIPYAPDEEQIVNFLALMPEAGTQTFFQGIERVESGHVVVVTPSGIISRRHWEPKRHTIKLASADEYAEALRHELDRAVRCRLRGSGDIGAQLSGGLDSSAVAATAARQLANTGRRVIAFTAVPREGYNGPSPRNRFIDEGPHAAATAAMYPNMEHVLIRTSRSPLDDLDRNFRLYDRPFLNLCNGSWLNSINDAARERKLTVMLTGQRGNTTLSYGGLEVLPELIRSGRWLHWWRQANALVAHGMRWRGALASTFGPWMPAALWVALHRLVGNHPLEITDYSALHPNRAASSDFEARAAKRGLDPVYRPWKDGFAMRHWILRRNDLGSYIKGVLGGWRLDTRDPTTDLRLIEFCFSVPTEEFARGGVQRALARRALADRLPRLVLDEQRKGYQAADWHEGLSSARDRMVADIDRLDHCAPAARALDVRKMRRLVKEWPSDGWERLDVMSPYRLALLRGLSAGHFLRRATGANR